MEEALRLWAPWDVPPESAAWLGGILDTRGSWRCKRDFSKPRHGNLSVAVFFQSKSSGLCRVLHQLAPDPKPAVHVRPSKNDAEVINFEYDRCAPLLLTGAPHMRLVGGMVDQMLRVLVMWKRKRWEDMWVEVSHLHAAYPPQHRHVRGW